MTIKRIFLSGCTLLVALLISLSLLNSWTKPQVQSQLELYQTDLLLHAIEWQNLQMQPETSPPQSSPKSMLLGEHPLQDALEQYEKVRKSGQTAYNEWVRSLPAPAAVPPNSEVELGSSPVQRSPQENLGQFLDELDLRLGILYTQMGQREKALALWTDVITEPKAQGSLKQRVQTAKVLLGLWTQPARLLPEAETQLQTQLSGWFRYQGLRQLYQLQQREQALVQLQLQEQEAAESALLRLVLVGGMPLVGGLAGLVVLVVWLGRQVLGRKSLGLVEQPATLTMPAAEGKRLSPVEAGERNQAGAAATTEVPMVLEPQLAAEPTQAVPWSGEIIWQVMVLWFTAFFLVSLLVIPVLVQVLGLDPTTFRARAQAMFALLNYGLLMAVGFAILYWSLKPFLERPLKALPLRWSRQWKRWGMGGYLAAMPLVFMVSLLNQRLLGNRGGGNPLLETIIQSQDSLTIAILFFMVAVLAPVFEETLFRGFFLTSLTRYLPAWGAIALSGFTFAIAHLNLSDLLPLTVLGMILGFIYLRSGNLLSSMLLHSLWNSGSFLGLLILGSAGR